MMLFFLLWKSLRELWKRWDSEHSHCPYQNTTSAKYWDIIYFFRCFTYLKLNLKFIMLTMVRIQNRAMYTHCLLDLVITYKSYRVRGEMNFFPLYVNCVTLLLSYSAANLHKMPWQKNCHESCTRHVQFCYGIICAKTCASLGNLPKLVLCFLLNVSSDRLACLLERAGFYFNKNKTLLKKTGSPSIIKQKTNLYNAWNIHS